MGIKIFSTSSTVLFYKIVSIACCFPPLLQRKSPTCTVCQNHTKAHWCVPEQTRPIFHSIFMSCSIFLLLILLAPMLFGQARVSPQSRHLHPRTVPLPSIVPVTCKNHYNFCKWLLFPMNPTYFFPSCFVSSTAITHGIQTFPTLLAQQSKKHQLFYTLAKKKRTFFF